jgi:uncharacterized repeat protein (TIGR03803 family)
MNKPTQHRSWILGMHRFAGAALALAVMLVVAGAATTSAQAQIYSVVYTFAGPDGAGPDAGLVLDTQGNLYGTTGTGGASNYGTVFKLDKTGKETVLYSFTGTPDGVGPGGLVRDAQGNLYGTTGGGGDSACKVGYGFGCGTVFKVDTAGNESVLFSFHSASLNGVFPNAGLALDAQGNLYGTTYRGGDGRTAGGTVFKVDATTGNETVLHSFGSPGDGLYPQAGLVWGAQGNLYGTTSYASGGTQRNPRGTVFETDTSGNEGPLYTFGGTSGEYPRAGVVQDAQGNLYGTTWEGGAYGKGTVFKLDTAGHETVLYSFTGKKGDGTHPQASLVLDAQGNLYGTTVNGGGALACSGGSLGHGCGTVFKVDKTGHETVLHRFTKTGGDGANPVAGLVLDANGNLYGTTANGGDSSCAVGFGRGCGTVFKLTP